jgi:hypothetical protein
VLRLTPDRIGRSRESVFETMPASYSVRQVPDGLMVNRIESHSPD